VQETRVNGNVTVKGSHLTKEEVVDLLNAELNKNNYAAIRNGRTLTIVDKNDAKTSRIPVRSGYNPKRFPDNAEIVTQIIRSASSRRGSSFRIDVVCLAAGHRGGERGGQLRGHHRHAVEHPAPDENHQGD